MLFHLDFHVDYDARMSQQDLFATWSREAAVAMDAKEAGVVVDLWKCAGERRVICIVDVDRHDALDEILLTLPTMVEMGQFVDVKVTALRRCEDFAASVDRLRQHDEGASGPTAWPVVRPACHWIALVARSSPGPLRLRSGHSPNGVVVNPLTHHDRQSCLNPARLRATAVRAALGVRFRGKPRLVHCTAPPSFDMESGPWPFAGE